MSFYRRYIAAFIMIALGGLMSLALLAHAGPADYTFDSLGRLSTVTNSGGTGTYTYDKVGNIMATGADAVSTSIYPLSLDFGIIYLNNTTDAEAFACYNHMCYNVINDKVLC